MFKIKPEHFSKLLALSYLIFFSLLMLYPIYWAFSGAFKTDIEIFNPAQIFPSKLTFSAFIPPTFQYIYYRWIANSFFVATVATIITVMISVPAGHALARARGRFYRSLSTLLILAYLFPAYFLIVGFVKLLSTWGLINTHLGLILVYVSFNTPYVTYLVYSYMFAVPVELEEALLIDGYSKWRVLTKIIFPLSFPIIITGALWTFMWSWNEIIYALVVLSSPELLTAPVGLATLQPGETITPWSTFWAFSLLYSIPPLIVFYSLQKYYISGLMRGAVKTA
ncbi:MAG: carbohydrate ABC transporter permease [Nitrososphaeria archaeon]